MTGTISNKDVERFRKERYLKMAQAQLGKKITSLDQVTIIKKPTKNISLGTRLEKLNRKYHTNK